MIKTYCGADCEACPQGSSCPGCVKTKGMPHGSLCPVAGCCIGKGNESCAACGECEMKAKLMQEINDLNVPGMPKVTKLFELSGAYVNLEYDLNGNKFKLLDDDACYLGNQLERDGSERCLGIAANDGMILVCEYGCNGADPEIVVLKRR